MIEDLFNKDEPDILTDMSDEKYADPLKVSVKLRIPLSIKAIKEKIGGIKDMFRRLFMVLFMLLVLTGLCYAGDMTPPVTPLVSLPNINLSGDTGYLYKIGFCAGIGSDLLSFKNDLVTLRGEVLWPSSSAIDAQTLVGGLGAMLDIMQASGYVKGQWKLGPIQPKMGPFVGYDFQNHRIAWGGLLQIVKVVF